MWLFFSKVRQMFNDVSQTMRVLGKSWSELRNQTEWRDSEDLQAAKFRPVARCSRQNAHKQISDYVWRFVTPSRLRIGKSMKFNLVSDKRAPLWQKFCAGLSALVAVVPTTGFQLPRGEKIKSASPTLKAGYPCAADDRISQGRYLTLPEQTTPV